MNWFKAKQTKIPLKADTVAELIEALRQCPQDYKIRNSDEGEFCELNIATDGTESMVSLY